MRKLFLFVAFFILCSFLAYPGTTVFAAATDCVQSVGSCSGTTPTRCPVPLSNGRTLFFCCPTQQDCTDRTTQTQAATSPSPSKAKICDFAGADKQQECGTCMDSGTGAWTALGCIQTDPKLFIGRILGISVGIGGGIAFLLILFGGFQILTSAGNPEKLNAGKELITSAITGLLIIVFSLFILRLIGFTIFGIPGFG